MPTRLITFAGSTVAVEYRGDRAAEIVDFLYRDLPAGSGPAQATYRLLAEDGSNQLSLYRDGELLHQSQKAADVADILLGNTCYHLAYYSRGGLLFHAAGLAWQEQGLLLPGTMGAGKSTLTAWLAARGFDYLTDEMVYLPHGSGTLQPLTRPLNLKHPSRPVLQEWLDYEAQAGRFYSSRTTDLIPPTLFNPDSRLSQPGLRLIIFPRYRAGAAFELTRLSKAQAGLEMMQCLVNARNLSDHGFDEITRLARGVPAYKMHYAGFEQVGDRIGALLQGNQPTEPLY